MKSKAGALVIVDNSDYRPEYLAHMRSPGNGYLSVPFDGDRELLVRLG